MTRYVALLVCAVATVSLIGCGGESQSENTQRPGENQPAQQQSDEWQRESAPSDQQETDRNESNQNYNYDPPSSETNE